MLLKLSNKIRECHFRAAEARTRAAGANDSSQRADFLETESQWLRLVEHYRFLEAADHVLDHSPIRPPVQANRLTQVDVPARFDSAEDGGSLAERLSALVRTAIAHAGGDARAAFFIADAAGVALHHITGMPQAYARYVDGFAIGPGSLACGLAASTRHAVITRDVVEDPRWAPWLWLAEEFDYRGCWSFPIETPAERLVGTFAMYFKEPRDATLRELELVAALTRVAADIISPQWQPVAK